ncbi:MAG: hypothetical protein SO046_08990 [Actinomyces urogenitalis]|uniref:hypothetical protein n=1 Tax=Actinomyces urogenitalis TaxID=103621 RepID=UPI002A83FC85|nr:hypothetical protein [Actinomyces urogenitalis]MDY3679328.1 hypothetical protein [Actinomyces urogenitalis]
MAPSATPRTGSIIFKIALLSIALIISDVGAVSPVLPELQSHFPGVSQTLIQGFISFPPSPDWWQPSWPVLWPPRSVSAASS